MTVDLAVRPAPGTRLTRRQRRRHRRRLAELDRRAAHLAGLHQVRAVLAAACEVLDTGWIRHSWFAYQDAQGRTRIATAHGAHRLGDHPVTAACLVGAIVQAGGGPASGGPGGGLAAVRSQPVQRALDVTWHALHGGGPAEPVGWCPPPPVRAAHVRDLTRWNDQPARTHDEVTGLLRAAERITTAEIERARA
jgi:hypothetical protein